MTAWLFPGQGSQKKGMGAELFEQFPELVAQADEILGYSLKTLCVDDPDGVLNQTQYTQPALFAVSAMAYLAEIAKGTQPPAYVAGHSLGEYSALFAAGVIDFATGLRLVIKRGELMSQSQGGSMTAVIGWSEQRLSAFLAEHHWPDVTIANYNSPVQYVLSGDQNQMQQVNSMLEQAGAMVHPLKVSGAFHSQMMAGAQAEFAQYLAQFNFQSPKVPVLSNVTAEPYQGHQFARLLGEQLTRPVRWQTCMTYLLDKQVQNFVEVGPGKVLTGLMRKIKKDYQPKPAKPENVITPQVLGCAEFRTRYQLQYSYCAGAMYKGIASKELVAAMAENHMLAFLGTGGQPLADIERDILYLQQQQDVADRFGVNLLCQMDAPDKEMEQVELYLRLGVTKVEAAAFYELRPSLVWFRLKGAKLVNGKAVAKNQLLAKISRPELAQKFFQPPAKALVEQLVSEGRLSQEEASIAEHLPLASDVCCEADSGGHTDRRAAMPVFTGIMALRDAMMKRFGYHDKIALGLAGGLGTPDAIAAAFMMGADFVTTGSINQCTVEAGTSEMVKDMLQEMGIEDTTYAPAGDMFELGVTIQVLKKGSLFAARGNKLWQLYQSYSGIDDIPADKLQQLEQKVFRCPVDEVWRQTEDYYQANYPQLAAKARSNPKYRMALIFKWYFVQSTRYARTGDTKHKANFQIHTGPAMGAFNQWAKDRPLASWRNRSVAVIGQTLMNEAASILTQRFNFMMNNFKGA